MRSLISIADPSYPTPRLLKSPDFVTLGSRTVEPFRTPFVARLDVVGSTGSTGRHGLLDNWLPFLIYGVFALVIPATMIYGSFVFATSPRRRSRARVVPFESGVSTGPPPQQRFTVSFYLTAMLFIVFDIEIVFLYPLAVILHQLAWFGLIEFLFFIAILVIAYVYVWRKGALEWQ
jgi:NADH-quinone oxidoreductase subunit A